MNRFYTSIKQSKHLLSLGMNPDTADMVWIPLNWQLTEYYVEVKQDGINTPKNPIPCWSLGALIDIMPSMIYKGRETFTLEVHKDALYHVCYRSHCHLDETWFSKENLLDAAFEMVVWLIENNYINKGE